MYACKQMFFEHPICIQMRVHTYLYVVILLTSNMGDVLVGPI